MIWRTVQEVSESEEERMGPGVIIRRSGKPIGQYWFKIADLDIFKPGKATAVARTQTGAASLARASVDVHACSRLHSALASTIPEERCTGIVLEDFR